jgi:hypothetical protein
MGRPRASQLPGARLVLHGRARAIARPGPAACTMRPGRAMNVKSAVFELGFVRNALPGRGSDQNGANVHWLEVADGQALQAPETASSDWPDPRQFAYTFDRITREDQATTAVSQRWSRANSKARK